jgi:hypothetical protein
LRLFNSSTIKLSLNACESNLLSHASIEINHENRTQSYHNGLSFPLDEKLSKTLPRWVSWAWFDYNVKHRPINLNYLFQYGSNNVYGWPPLHAPSLLELDIFLEGIAKNVRQLSVFRIKHVSGENHYSPDDDYISTFSYAFGLVTDRHLKSKDPPDPYWIFFLRAASLDGRGRDVMQIEKKLSKIQNEIKVFREYPCIEFEKLKKFLIKNANTFGNKRFDEINDDLIPPHPYTFTKEFHESYEKCILRYENGDFSHSLRDLRALVQEALVLTCKNLNLWYTYTNGEKKKESKIHEMVDLLISNGSLDKHQRYFASAFTDVANLSSHGDYPDHKAMEDYLTRGKILITFQIGANLIKHLEKIRENWRKETQR